MCLRCAQRWRSPSLAWPPAPHQNASSRRTAPAYTQCLAVRQTSAAALKPSSELCGACPAAPEACSHAAAAGRAVPAGLRAGSGRFRVCMAARPRARLYVALSAMCAPPAARTASTLRYRLCVRHLPRTRLYVALSAMCAPPMVAPHHWVL